MHIKSEPKVIRKYILMFGFVLLNLWIININLQQVGKSSLAAQFLTSDHVESFANQGKYLSF